MTELRDIEQPTQEEYFNRLVQISHRLGVRRCKRCLLPYLQGYFCWCGWDNSYEFPPKVGDEKYELALNLQEKGG